MTEPARTWSPQQSEIFEAFKSHRAHCIIRARAGTGKTTSILEGINHAPERKILLVAFNKAIAVELQQRLKNRNATAKTLHSLGLSAIMRSGWGCPAGRKIEVDQDRGRNTARRLLGITKDDRHLQPVATAVARLASVAKGAAPYATEADLEDLADEYDIFVEDRELSKVYTQAALARFAARAMDESLKEDGSVDYDDMVFVPVRRKLARPEYGLVAIDEAQT